MYHQTNKLLLNEVSKLRSFFLSDAMDSCSVDLYHALNRFHYDSNLPFDRELQHSADGGERQAGETGQRIVGWHQSN